MEEFITPPNHTHFLAKRLFDGNGKIEWGAIAYIDKDGGGPVGGHSHAENHIFIVVDGEVRVVIAGEAHIVGKDESFFVRGELPHSIWNNGELPARVIKISVK